MLLTLPTENRQPTFEEYLKNQLGTTVDRATSQDRQAYQEWLKSPMAKDAGRREGEYKSSHWSEPNILAHVRMNDRTGPNGEKILFLEEVQSDYGQDYRKQLNNIEKTVEKHFKDVVKSMEKAGVLKEIC
jgi:anaerobic selenocysteine-containing dehydrogenase